MSITDTLLNTLSDQSYEIVTSSIFTDPIIESSILSDTAHLILDFATFYVNTNDTMLLQLLTIIGRILTLVSDYLPDNQITPDELLYQFFMLGLSLKSWVNDLHSIVQANQHPATFQERRLYRIVFLPVGMTWYQYRALMSQKMALVEWVHMRPGDAILQDNFHDCIYLLYRGDIVQIFENSSGLKRRQGRQLRYFSQDRKNNNNTLIYERELALKLLETINTSRTKLENGTNTDCSKDDAGTRLSYEKTKPVMIEAGKRGASLLRIDMNKLLKLVERDSHLAVSFQKIFLYESLKNRLD